MKVGGVADIVRSTIFGLAAVSAPEVVFAGLQLVVWIGAAVLLLGDVTGFAGRPVTAVSAFAGHPASDVASGWRCQRCQQGGWSVQVSRLTDVTLM